MEGADPMGGGGLAPPSTSLDPPLHSVCKVEVRVNRGRDGQADRQTDKQTGSSSGALIRMSGFHSNIPGSFPTSGWYEMQIRRNICDITVEKRSLQRNKIAAISIWWN